MSNSISFDQTFKNIDDILYKDAGSDSELDYVGQTSWVLFLKHLDELDQEKSMKGNIYLSNLDGSGSWFSVPPNLFYKLFGKEYNKKEFKLFLKS